MQSMNHREIDTALTGMLLDQIPDFVCICRDGIVSEVNSAAARLLDDHKDALRGRRFAELVHPDYRDALADGLEILVAGSPLLLLSRADGSVVDVELQAAPLEKGCFIISAHDVSARVRVAASMVESENRFRHLVDLTMDLISVWHDGRIIFMNAAGARMLGYEHPAALLNLRLEDIVHPDWREVASLGVAGLADELGHLPLMFRRNDGETVQVEVSVKPFGGGDSYMMDARDVTALKRTCEALRHSEQHLRRVVDSVADAILVFDNTGGIRSANRAAETIFGYQAGELVGKSFAFLLREHHGGSPNPFPENPPRHAGQHALLIDHHMVGNHKSGNPIPVEVTVTELHEGKETLRIAVVRDISERRKAEERIRHQATHDILTDLPNRTLFFSRFEQFLATAKRRSRQGALLLLNLDGFKLINDTLGQQMGDRLLQAVAGRLKGLGRTEEFLARLGSDDFVVIQPEIEASYEAAITAQRLIDALEEPFQIEGFEVNVSASIGVTLFPEDGNEANDLLKNASAALLRAKEQGRGAFGMFTADLNELVNERLSIRNGLTRALDQGEFSLVYQPKVDLNGRTLAGVEALLRWHSPDHGPISPVKFIPVLEETSMIGTVGQWVIEQACAQQRAWTEQGFPGIRVAVNLSVRQLRSGLVPMVESILNRMGVPPQMLEIEITESLLMRDTDHAVQMLRSLAEMGIELAIDDFGTGYSSLSYLKRLPLNNIKIDRSFITDLGVDPDATEIVRTIVAMGHSLRRRIIAEGVETAEQLAVLEELGCDEIQGYYFSPPVAPDRIIQLLQAGQAFTAPAHPPLTLPAHSSAELHR